MRIYFKSMARPKRVARTMRDIFPLEKLSQCQAWTAKIYGYRDWHDLEQITGAGEHDPSPDDEDLGEKENYSRNAELSHVIADVLGIGLPDDFFVSPRLNLTSRGPVKPARRASKVPKGTNPFYTLIQTDLLDSGDRDVNAIYDDQYTAYAIAPHRYGPELDYRTKLIKLLKRKAKPYPGFAKDCEYLLTQPILQGTQFDWDEYEFRDGSIWLSQTLNDRYYIFDEDEQPVGFLEVTLTIEADSDRDDGNRLEMRVVEAWIAGEENQWLLSSMAASMFSGAVARILVAWHQSEPLPLELVIISDSEHLLAKRFLEDVAEQAADLQIDREEIGVYYDD